MKPSTVTKACDILIALRDEGPMTRIQLVEYLGFSRATLHWMLKSLADSGFVDVVQPKRVFGQGRRPFVFSLNAGWRKE